MQFSSMTNLANVQPRWCPCQGTCGFTCAKTCTGCKGSCVDTCIGKVLQY